MGLAHLATACLSLNTLFVVATLAILAEANGRLQPETHYHILAATQNSVPHDGGKHESDSTNRATQEHTRATLWQKVTHSRRLIHGGVSLGSPLGHACMHVCDGSAARTFSTCAHAALQHSRHAMSRCFTCSAMACTSLGEAAGPPSGSPLSDCSCLTRQSCMPPCCANCM